MSESMDPQNVSVLLNRYFALMTKILFKYDGTLDKFMGDAIMAFFGNPNPYEDHAIRAISMSLEMRDAMSELNRELQNDGQNTIDIGIPFDTLRAAGTPGYIQQPGTKQPLPQQQ